MQVTKLESFRRSNPRATVIIPSQHGLTSPRVTRILDSLQSQTFQDFEVVVVAGVSPNGRARNEAISSALGEYLIFIDETATLAHDCVLDHLIKAFSERPGIGIAGACCRVLSTAGYIQQEYAAIRQFASPVVKELTESWQVQHICMAMPKKIYIQVGGESDRLITGTDDDLKRRVHAFGYTMFLVPDAIVEYCPPSNLSEIAGKSYLKGLGSAFALIHYPGLFELSQRFRMRRVDAAVIYKLISWVGKLLCPWFWIHPVRLLSESCTVAGFIAGAIRWHKEKPDTLRTDLRFRNGLGG